MSSQTYSKAHYCQILIYCLVLCTLVPTRAHAQFAGWLESAAKDAAKETGKAVAIVAAGETAKAAFRDAGSQVPHLWSAAVVAALTGKDDQVEELVFAAARAEPGLATIKGDLLATLPALVVLAATVENAGGLESLASAMRTAISTIAKLQEPAATDGAGEPPPRVPTQEPAGLATEAAIGGTIEEVFRRSGSRAPRRWRDAVLAALSGDDPKARALLSVAVDSELAAAELGNHIDSLALSLVAVGILSGKTIEAERFISELRATMPRAPVKEEATSPAQEEPSIEPDVDADADGDVDDRPRPAPEFLASVFMDCRLEAVSRRHEDAVSVRQVALEPDRFQAVGTSVIGCILVIDRLDDNGLWLTLTDGVARVGVRVDDDDAAQLVTASAGAVVALEVQSRRTGDAAWRFEGSSVRLIDMATESNERVVAVSPPPQDTGAPPRPATREASPRGQEQPASPPAPPVPSAPAIAPGAEGGHDAPSPSTEPAPDTATPDPHGDGEQNKETTTATTPIFIEPPFTAQHVTAALKELAGSRITLLLGDGTRLNTELVFVLERQLVVLDGETMRRIDFDDIRSVERR